jgi:hypothetical protein
MSAPICTCCDRTFVTTARFARQSSYANYIDLLSNHKPNPYLYDNPNEFEVVNAKIKPQTGDQEYNPAAIALAAVGLAWAGMMVNGQKSKGVVMMIASLAWVVLAAMVARDSQTLLLFTCVSGIGGYLVGLVDVICVSNRIKANEAVAAWDWF